ncbi:MAG: hypothetical protein KIT68_04835 [Phycisphaeraceae bacterium]|nr:hypothetical protein [Phycisphaeraceae bacterium]
MANSEQGGQSGITGPKPFVFVLMPFDPSFDDTYKFGIKGASDDVGAYAERVDEQQYSEGILDRILNQINKSDVIVADMSGKNPNVFYEVGYAHALNKLVILVTKTVDDIPFDLKHKRHIVYEGQIKRLREELARSLSWAIEESKRRAASLPLAHVDVLVDGTQIRQFGEQPVVKLEGEIGSGDITLAITFRNSMNIISEPISHIYLLTERSSVLRPKTQLKPVSNALFRTFLNDPIIPSAASATDLTNAPLNQYKLDFVVSSLPSGALEDVPLHLQIVNSDGADEVLILRLHSGRGVQSFAFHLKIKVKPSADTK